MLLPVVNPRTNRWMHPTHCSSRHGISPYLPVGWLGESAYNVFENHGNRCVLLTDKPYLRGKQEREG